MKLLKLSTQLILSALLFSACGGGSSKGDGKGDDSGGSKKDTSSEKVTSYNYKPKSTQVAITTYKHTSKTGVGIKFDSIDVSGVGSDAKSVSALFKGTSFKIPISGLNSGDSARDDKIREHFFGTMKGTKVIKGSIEKLKMKGKKGEALLKVSMNGKSQEIEGDLEMKQQKLTLSGEIDVMNWDGKEALNALQKACEAKHTGDDGKTKLWSTVALNISTELDVKEQLAS